MNHLELYGLKQQPPYFAHDFVGQELWSLKNLLPDVGWAAH